MKFFTESHKIVTDSHRIYVRSHEILCDRTEILCIARCEKKLNGAINLCEAPCERLSFSCDFGEILFSHENHYHQFGVEKLKSFWRFLFSIEVNIQKLYSSTPWNILLLFLLRFRFPNEHFHKVIAVSIKVL